MKNKIFILLLSLICLTTTPLEAKWWIFGGGEDEIGFDYLYVGNLSFDDIDEQATLLQDSLDEGSLHVRGKARAGNGQIGAIRVSLDGSKTWEKASFEKDGGFDFSFEPDLEKSYDIYVKVIDTSGKSNEIIDSHVVVSFSDLDVSEAIIATLSKLKNAYQEEDENIFMQYVSSSFEGDDVTLERALRKDFVALDDIRIDFTLNSVASSNNRYYASIFFNRHVSSAIDGTSYDDSGVTEFTFEVGEQGAMLLSMKNPLLFGLSYAGDVVSGTVVSAQNSEEYLSISDDGTVSKKSLEDIVAGNEDDDYATSGSFTLEISCIPPCNTADGFNFTNDEETALISSSEIFKENDSLWPNGGTRLLDLGVSSIDGITVPESGYGDPVLGSALLEFGRAIAVKLTNNTYAVIKVTSFISNGSVSFSYKYNPGGSRAF